MADQIPEVAIVEDLCRLGALEAENARLKAELNEASGEHAELWADRNGWRARAEIAEADNARLKAREQSIAKALGVCDGGEYANDIVAAVERLKAELAKERERLDWLNDDDQLVDVIYLDDGTVIDVRGLDVRAAIDAARSRA